MNAGKAVYGILSANSGVTDIVGTRIFPEIAEQEAVTPFVIYQLQSVAPEDTHDGPSKLDEVRFEFLCYADSYNAAADLGVAVRAALDRVSGTYNGVHVESVQFNDVDVDIEYDPRRYSQVLKFTFRIKRDDVTIALGTPVTGAVLGDLSDVDVTGVTNGQLIAYNDVTGNWEAADDAGGVTRITQLEDTAIVTPDDRELLLYDGGQWVNDTLGKGDVGLANVDNTSDANKPVSTATQTALDAKADTSAVPSELNDLSDVTITGTPTGNQALIYDATASVFKSTDTFTNRFEDEAENNKQSIVPFAERVYTVKADGDGIFIDAQSDTPTAGKVIKRKIYQKAGFLESGAVIGDFTLIHTFADDTAYSATESTFEGFRDGDTYGTPPFTLIQTWEEVDESTLLLDTYTGAAAAYSLRKLRTLYTGDAINVWNGTSYADIGFDGSGELDTTALAAHCGSNDGFIRYWYDQSSNSNDATQTTTADMPKIYDGTTGVVTENGKPALEFNNDVLQCNVTSSDIISTDAENTLVSVMRQNSATANNTLAHMPSPRYVIYTDFSGTLYYDAGNNSTNRLSVSSPSGWDDNQHLLFWSCSLTLQQICVDGAQLASDTNQSTITSASTTLDIGTRSTTYLDGFVQELIFYNSDQSSNRTNIEDNINTFYNIY